MIDWLFDDEPSDIKETASNYLIIQLESNPKAWVLAP